jgi:NAD(P)-dependent dehydrogenase (short-subunit alcohol dehydrogenase family)
MVDDRTILITGATSGLGRALAQRLAATGATVLLHGRDAAKGERTLAEISKATGNDRLEWYRADFADLHEVQDMADAIRDRHTQLHALVNNAGIGPPKPGTVRTERSAQGHELCFAVDYLAHFALTRALYPVLNQTGHVDHARIVNVSSTVQAPLDFDNTVIDRFETYGQSKLAQIMMTLDLAERFRDTHVAAVAVHPLTVNDTKKAQTSTTPDARATAALIDEMDLPVINGKFFNVSTEERAHRQAYDVRVREQLRNLSEELTGF